MEERMQERISQIEAASQQKIEEMASKMTRIFEWAQKQGYNETDGSSVGNRDIW